MPNAFYRSNDEYLRFGFFYPYATGGAGTLSRRCDVNLLDINEHKRIAKAAENAGFDYLFLADKWDDRIPGSNAHPEPVNLLFAFTLAALLVPVTERIGIVSTVHTAFFNPAVVARQGAMIDALSGGRWGVNIVSGNGQLEGFIGSSARGVDHDGLYVLADEFVSVLKDMWSGQHIQRNGKYFQFTGQLPGPLPVQDPWPAIISAGASEAGRELAAAHADYLFIHGGAGAGAFAELKETMDSAVARHGRPAGALKFQTNFFTCVRDTQAEADAMLEAVKMEVDVEVGRDRHLAYASRGATTSAKAYGRPQTDEEVRDRMAGGVMVRMFSTPERIAEKLIELHSTTDVRGVAVLFPGDFPNEVQRFAKSVFPLLREAGVWIPPTERGYSW